MALFSPRHFSSNKAFRPLGVMGALVMIGCLDRPLEPLEPRTTSTYYDKVPQLSVDKIDLLLTIDNSGSMADKQAILADAVPDLVRGLVNPACLDDLGKPVANQPSGPLDKCPSGAHREFEPVLDIHIGIISSSLGGRGSTNCPATTDLTASNDDRAHLLDRKDPTGGTGAANTIPTYQGKGFLAWDPAQKLEPHGEKEIGDVMGSTGIVPTLREMVKGVGQAGCGYEAQLESWYRFLVDPEPYAKISADFAGRKPVVVEGLDDELLAERRDFLRPDSLVAIIMLTDENDCSIKDQGLAYLSLETTQFYHLPRARKECKADPNDPCCKSCGSPQGECPDDPTCNQSLTDAEDPVNLRCFDQKRRYGIDFLQPLDRYTDALKSQKIATRGGDLVDNPLFSRPEGDTTINVRSPESEMVFLAGIVGVPWQDVARRDAQGKPSLLSGLDAHGNPVGGFMTAEELDAKTASGLSGWDIVFGDPAANKAPADPLMVESREERTGQNPITGDAIAPSTASSPGANPINGHEWKTGANSGGDLQYACVFDLPMARDCATDTNCDCHDAGNNPLCQDTTGAYTKTQYRAKAYPGLRELGVLKGLGEQGIVGSVCPAQLSNTNSRDYGYRPAIGAIIDRLKSKLNGQCLPRALTPDEKKKVSCLIIEGRRTDAGQCSCEGAGLAARQDVQPEHQAALDKIAEDETLQGVGLNCFCEVKQLDGEDLEACQYDKSDAPVNASGEPVNGWCYIDATPGRQAGDPALVENCPVTEKRKLRFVGEGEPLTNSTLFITCSGE